jgi:uncharacterized membrane protein
MGSLNASHASLEAFAHASPNSVVGQLAAYAQALNNYATTQNEASLAQAAHALALASNNPLNASVVNAVNANLMSASVLSTNLSLSPNEVNAVVEMANQDQASR